MARRPASSLLVWFAAPALCALLALACDSGTQEPAPPAPEPTTSAAADSGSKPSAADPSADRSAAPIDPARIPRDLPEGVSAEIPDNFPEDLPVYPGATPAQGRGAELDGVPMSAVQLMTTDAPSRVLDYYRAELERSGWTIEESREMGDNASMTATKGDCEASVLITPASDGGSDIYLVSQC